MDGILKPFSGLLELISKHGIVRSLFALTILVVLAIGPVYLWQQAFTGDSDEVTSVLEVDTSGEIHGILMSIRNELKAETVRVAEFFLTADGYTPGFSPGGSYIATYEVRSPLDTHPSITIGVRYPLRASPGEPNAFIAAFSEKLRVEGFLFFPDVGTSPLPEEFANTVGNSYYVIAGYDVKGVMIISVHILYFTEQTILTEDDLKRSVGDVQEIVALLVEG